MEWVRWVVGLCELRLEINIRLCFLRGKIYGWLGLRVLFFFRGCLEGRWVCE